ncbi:MAG TPA: hypothetical protein VGM03_05355 [Phycisphaerae bacterium]
MKRRLTVILLALVLLAPFMAGADCASNNSDCEFLCFGGGD